MANPRNMSDILQSPYFNDIYGEKEPDNLLTFQQFTELKPSLHSFGYGSDELLDSLLPGDLRGWDEGNFELNYGDMVNMPDWGATFGTDYNFPEILGGSASLDAALDAAANTPGGSWMDIELTPEESSWGSDVSPEEAARRSAFLDTSVGTMEALRQKEAVDNILHAAGPGGVNKWSIGENGDLSPITPVEEAIADAVEARTNSEVTQLAVEPHQHPLFTDKYPNMEVPTTLFKLSEDMDDVMESGLSLDEFINKFDSGKLSRPLY